VSTNLDPRCAGTREATRKNLDQSHAFFRSTADLHGHHHMCARDGDNSQPEVDTPGSDAAPAAASTPGSTSTTSSASRCAGADNA
jgi:hypothetical protein